MYFFEIIGILFSIFLFIVFFKKLNYTIPLLELFILVISINYIVSPFLIYNYFISSNNIFDKYYVLTIINIISKDIILYLINCNKLIRFFNKKLTNFVL